LWKVFWDRVSWSICPGWFRTAILLISASLVARITCVSHQHLAFPPRFFEFPLLAVSNNLYYGSYPIIIKIQNWNSDLTLWNTAKALTVFPFHPVSNKLSFIFKMAFVDCIWALAFFLFFVVVVVVVVWGTGI
jgi:hypothetical protein